MNTRPFPPLSSLAWVAASIALTLTTGLAEAATVSGFVRDGESGEFLPHANVIVRGTQLGAVSNTNGYYAISGLGPGRHNVTVTYLGYRETTQGVSVVGTQDTRLDVSLEPEPIVLEATVTEADRSEEERILQASFISVETRKLRDLPAVGEIDLMRGLQMLPGIQAASDISTGLYVRGGGPDQTLILLDQIPLYNPSHAFGFFSTFNADAIRDMQLHKGTYPAEYGGRLGAVLDVSNREGNRNDFEGQGGTSLIASRMTLEGPAGEGSWILSGRRTYLEPMLAAIRASGTDVPSYYFYDVNARLTQDIGDSDKVTLSGYFGRDDLNFEIDTNTQFGLRWGNTALTAKWTHVFAPTVFGNFVAWWSRYESLADFTVFGTNVDGKTAIEDLSLKADLDWFIGADHTVTFGATGSAYGFDYKSTFNREEQMNSRINAVLLAAYVQDRWQLSPRTLLRGGVRTNYYSEEEALHVEPRISVSHAITAEIRAKASAGTYHQYLQLVTTEGFSGSDAWLPLDESVDPGASAQFAAGIEWEPSPEWQITFDGYRTDLDHLVALDTRVSADAAKDKSTSDDFFITDGEGWAAGFEFFAQRRLGAITGWFGYGLGWSERRFDELNDGEPFAPKYDRRHDLSLVMTWRKGPWTFGLNQLYATGQAFTPAASRYRMRDPANPLTPPKDAMLPAPKNSARLLPYHRMDLSVKRQVNLFGLEADAYLQIFNAYNRSNEWFIQYDTENPEVEPVVATMLPMIPTIGLDYRF